MWICSSDIECRTTVRVGSTTNFSVPAMPMLSSIDYSNISTPTGNVSLMVDCSNTAACNMSESYSSCVSDNCLLAEITILEPWNLETALNTPSLWQNSTWAAGVTFDQGPTTCLDTQEQLYLNSMANNIPPPDRPLPHYSLDGCLSTRIDERCRLFFNPLICLIVIMCGLIKTTCMFFTARLNPKEVLLTTGDAIASFLTRPDPTTHGHYLMSRLDIREDNQASAYLLEDSHQWTSRTALSLRKGFWMSAVSIRRWIITLIL